MNGYGDWNNLEDNRIHVRRHEQQFSKDSLVSAMENFVKTVNIMNETILVPCRLMDRQIGDDDDKIQSSESDNSNTDRTITKLTEKNGLEWKNIHETLKSADLFNLFNILNATKNDLLWTGNEAMVTPIRNDIPCLESNDEANTTNAKNVENNHAQDTNVENSTLNETANKGHHHHQRRPSTASLSSIASISDITSDFSAENDSGVESESGGGKNNNIKTKPAYSVVESDKATELSKLCKFHLFGLYQCLEQMTEAANYLTTRYQSDVGSV